jgi:hypothetical protein
MMKYVPLATSDSISISIPSRLFSDTSIFPSLQIDVLKVINYIDSDLVVQLKGRVACEMNSGEELISTECLFENQLEELEPEEAVAIMSAFVFQQRNASEPSLTPKLAEAKKRLYFVFLFFAPLFWFLPLSISRISAVFPQKTCLKDLLPLCFCLS